MKQKTIYEALKEKLKREPTHNELVNEVLRILTQVKDENKNVTKKRGISANTRANKRDSL